MKTLSNVQTALVLAALLAKLGFATSAQADSFTYTGALTVPRVNHTATLLPDGKVLVAGGFNNGCLSSTEIYDSAKGMWTPTGSLNTARRFHTATLLPDGRVLVSGGWNSSGREVASAELYDPAAGAWTMTGTMRTNRARHSATLLLNGKVLAAGGVVNSGYSAVASVELFDPISGTWTLTGSLAVSRGWHTATILSNGQVLVAGGRDFGDWSSTEIYDPASGTWTVAAALKAARHEHTATMLSNGRALIVAGWSDGVGYLSSGELYDRTTGLWTPTTALSSNRSGHVEALLPNGKVLIAGGQNFSGYLGSAEVYDPSTGNWETVGSLGTARRSATATVLRNGKVLIAGGENSIPLFSAELYDSVFRISLQPQSQLSCWGKSVSFSVAATNGTPPYGYQWHKDATPIWGATNASLLLTNLQSSDAGSYRVVVSDAATNITSQPATLVVEPACVNIALYAGVTIEGLVGQTYGVQSTADLSNTNSWVGRTNITLTTPAFLWYDSQPATQPHHYYRVVLGPIPIP